MASWTENNALTENNASGEWKVIAEPSGQNGEDGTNQSGLIIFLVRDADVKHEVSRVGFARRNSQNPKTGFDKQLQKELGKAQWAADTMNRLAREAAESLMAVGDRLAEVDAGVDGELH